MADAQISWSGPIFSKISLMDAICFGFAQLADFDYEETVLYSAQDAGVLDEIVYCVCTWFFSTKAWLLPAVRMCCIPEKTAKKNA